MISAWLQMYISRLKENNTIDMIIVICIMFLKYLDIKKKKCVNPTLEFRVIFDELFSLECKTGTHFHGTNSVIGLEAWSSH